MEHARNQMIEFHTAFNLPMSFKPELPKDEKLRKLRRDILIEEFSEYLLAEGSNDIVEIADALGDIIYVAIGTALSYGIPIHKIFDEIHASNMSKLDENGHPILRADGKVLKSERYFKPNIKKILDQE